MSTLTHGMLLGGAAGGLALASLVLWRSGLAWLDLRKPMDLALCMAAAIWAAYLLTGLASFFVAGAPPSAYVSHAGVQALIISVSFFLLSSAGLNGTVVYLVLGVQAAAGLLALHGAGSGWRNQAYPAWVAVNLVSAVLLSLLMAHRAYVTRSQASLLALTGCLMGIGIYVDDVMAEGQLPPVGRMSHHVYAACLLLIWYLVPRKAVQASPVSDPATVPEQHFSGFETISTMVRGQETPSVAVTLERRRIAQDLHDGVGSRIVGILSSLGSQTPQQRQIALALEQCLVELKMTVDAMDNLNDSVVEALGRMRYRFQHALDKLGIRMTWRVDICDELDAVRGNQALQVHHIAQECLSNIMRHAHASSVRVVCRYVPETNSLLLLVYDNGKGIDRSKLSEAGGKGLPGMRRRAQSIGAELTISSKPGTGTCVRLSMPLSPSPAQAMDLSTAVAPETVMGQVH